MAETEHDDTGEDAARDPGEKRREAKAARTAARTAKQIGAFSARHGGAEGLLSYLGAKGTRIVLVGDDGSWGDLFAPTDAVARSAAEQAGLTLHDTFDGELAAKVATGPYEWKRMAGIQLGGRGTA